MNSWRIQSEGNSRLYSPIVRSSPPYAATVDEGYGHTARIWMFHKLEVPRNGRSDQLVHQVTNSITYSLQ